MIFEHSAVSIINMILLAVGVGVCVQVFLQVNLSPASDEKLKRGLQFFFATQTLSAATQLAVQTLTDQPGELIRPALYVFQFLSLTAGGVATFLLSLLVLGAAGTGRRIRLYQTVLCVLAGVHVLVMVSSFFSDAMYSFDANNAYHRNSLFPLADLGVVLMLMADAVILIRFRANLNPRFRTAIWFYILAPIAANILQLIAPGLQYILFSMTIAAVYVSRVIFREESEAYETKKMQYSLVAAELSMAASIQSNMLPNTFPAFPGRSEFDIYASMTPAKEVGGDFYDFFMIDGDHLALLIADVSGKGVPAALFMMTARTMIKGASHGARSPAQVLRFVNAQICENNPENMFVTVWLGFLEISTGSLLWADAGHDPLALYQDGAWMLLPRGGGVALGFLEPELLDPDPYADHEVRLKPGDAVFQYTDGVTEAMTEELEQFGYDRLLEALNVSPSADPETLLPRVRTALDAFVKGAPQFDDITMLSLRYRGKA